MGSLKQVCEEILRERSHCCKRLRCCILLETPVGTPRMVLRKRRQRQLNHFHQTFSNQIKPGCRRKTQFETGRSWNFIQSQPGTIAVIIYLNLFSRQWALLVSAYLRRAEPHPKGSGYTLKYERLKERPSFFSNGDCAHNEFIQSANSDVRCFPDAYCTLCEL